MKDAYWIGDPAETKLAIVPRPRGGDWLETDLSNLKCEGIDILISILTREEEIELGLEQERELAESLGITFYSYPIPDRSTPADLSSFRAFVSDLSKAIEHGKKAGAHCRGGIGRATIVTASILIAGKWSAERALLEIEARLRCARYRGAEALDRAVHPRSRLAVTPMRRQTHRNIPPRRIRIRANCMPLSHQLFRRRLIQVRHRHIQIDL